MFDVQSYELLIYLCGRGDAARDEMERRIIVCAASFLLLLLLLFYFFVFLLFALYDYCWILAVRRKSEKNSSAALEPGPVATLSCINSRGGAYLFHVYLPSFTPALHLIIFTAALMLIEK